MATSNISTLARRVQQNPQDSFSKFALALELLKIDEVHKARLLFESVREYDPDYVGVYYHLGQVYRRLDDHNHAVDIFRQGITVASGIGDQHARKELEEALQTTLLELDE
ncbi:MAG: hypothetical protein ACNA78_07840 [Balneolaceae bacterium]